MSIIILTPPSHPGGRAIAGKTSYETHTFDTKAEAADFIDSLPDANAEDAEQAE